MRCVSFETRTAVPVPARRKNNEGHWSISRTPSSVNFIANARHTCSAHFDKRKQGLDRECLKQLHKKGQLR